MTNYLDFITGPIPREAWGLEPGKDTTMPKKSEWPVRPIKVDNETWDNGEVVARTLGLTWGGRGNVSELVRVLLGMTEKQAEAIEEILNPKNQSHVPQP